MATITLSIDAAQKARQYAVDTCDALLQNIKVMDSDVNEQFRSLNDPTFNQYLALSANMDDIFKQIAGKLGAIANYCDQVIIWIQQYSET